MDELNISVSREDLDVIISALNQFQDEDNKSEQFEFCESLINKLADIYNK